MMQFVWQQDIRIHHICFMNRAIGLNITNNGFFLPRRASKEPYDEVLDENRCGNILIRSDDKFNDITVTTVGELNRSRGYSAFRFIPNTKDKFMIATKTEEDPNTKRMKSYITVFHVDGKIVLNDQLIGENKYEGIEFL